MEISKNSNILKNSSTFHSSFEEEINEINNNKSYQNLESKLAPINKLLENEKCQNIFIDKKYEEADLDEIYDLLNKFNQNVLININKVDKKDYYINKRRAYSKENKRIKFNNHINECQEIISILKKPLYNKNLFNKNLYNTSFNPLLKPKKISLVGKVIFNNPNDNNNYNNIFFSLEKNNNNLNENNLSIMGN